MRNDRCAPCLRRTPADPAAPLTLGHTTITAATPHAAAARPLADHVIPPQITMRDVEKVLLRARPTMSQAGRPRHL
jgi:hypothetical protein